MFRTLYHKESRLLAKRGKNVAREDRSDHSFWRSTVPRNFRNRPLASCHSVWNRRRIYDALERQEDEGNEKKRKEYQKELLTGPRWKGVPPFFKIRVAYRPMYARTPIVSHISSLMRATVTTTIAIVVGLITTHIYHVHVRFTRRRCSAQGTFVHKRSWL